MSTNTNWRKFIKSPMRDLGLQVGEKIYWVSRRRLADLSPVFQSMLYGEFQESKKEIVKLSDKEPREILEMLRCLFPTRGQGNKTKPIGDQNLEIIMKLADEYEIKDLMEKCSTFMVKKLVQNEKHDWNRDPLVKIDETLNLIDLANQYHLKSAVRVGLRCLSTFNPSILLSNQSFINLPMNMRLAVSTIAWFRGVRPPPSHIYLDESDDDDDLPDDWSDFSSSCTSRCKYCRHEKCNSRYRGYYCHYHGFEDGDVACDPICHTCKKKYGSTDFVCECIDPTIIIELDTLGL